MNSQTTSIDLAKYKSANAFLFTGRPQGEAVRKELDLDKLDKENIIITFLIPENTSGFNPSFYLGLLFKSYETLGIERFQKKYAFKILSENNEIIRIINKDLSDGHRSAINSLNKPATSLFDSFFK